MQTSSERTPQFCLSMLGANGEVYHSHCGWTARRRKRGAARSAGVRRLETGAEAQLATAKKNSFEYIFLLHAKTSLVFFECELALPQRRERGSFRRTRVKIEFFAPSGPAARQFHHDN